MEKTDELILMLECKITRADNSICPVLSHYRKTNVQMVLMVGSYNKALSLRYCSKVTQAKCANFVFCSRELRNFVRKFE